MPPLIRLRHATPLLLLAFAAASAHAQVYPSPGDLRHREGQVFIVDGPEELEQLPPLMLDEDESAPPTAEEVFDSEPRPAAEPAEIPPDAEIELFEERYPSGEMKISREVTQDIDGNYVNHGVWKQWDRQGRTLVEGAYRRDRMHGQWIRWYYERPPRLLQQPPLSEFTPPFTSQATFKEGKLHGVWTIFDAQQRTMLEIHFEEGKRHGAIVWRRPSGEPAREMTYRDGLLDGESRQYGPDGELVATKNYKKGRLHAERSSRGGGRRWTGEFLHPRLVEKTPDDWRSATLATYATEGELERHGAWSTWHANGQMESQGQYEHGEPAGRFTWWYSNGQIALEGKYAGGAQHGKWQWWHKNGQKAAVGSYQNGAPDGGWTWWRSDGAVAHQTDYSETEGEIVGGPDERRRAERGRLRLRR